MTRLDTIEDAASIDVLCLDKTGTITENRLSVTDCMPLSGYKKADAIAAALLASREEEMDLIDLAVIAYAASAGMILEGYKQISYAPFNPSDKRTEAIVEAAGKRFRVVKGAPQIVVALCKGITEDAMETVNTAIEDSSRKGYRVLAVAGSESDDLDNLKLAGLLSLSDPPRADSRSVIEEAKRQGTAYPERRDHSHFCAIGCNGLFLSAHRLISGFRRNGVLDDLHARHRFSEVLSVQKIRAVSAFPKYPKGLEYVN